MNYIFSIGGEWAEKLETSLSRKLANIGHFNLGNALYNISFEEFVKLANFDLDVSKARYEEAYKELVSNTTQASRVLHKLRWYVSRAGIIFIETDMLDTGIGHQILVFGETYRVPVYGVGMTSSSSMLAPAYLKGILYPDSPDILVNLALQRFHEEKPSPKQPPASEQLYQPLETKTGKTGKSVNILNG